MAQAGDKCDFTGTLIVVPDVSTLSTPGIYNLTIEWSILTSKGQTYIRVFKFNVQGYFQA